MGSATAATAGVPPPPRPLLFFSGSGGGGPRTFYTAGGFEPLGNTTGVLHFSMAEYRQEKLVALGFPTLISFAAFLRGEKNVFSTPFLFQSNPTKKSNAI